MKKFLSGVCGACAMLLLTSCYSSTVTVGSMRANEPAMCVNTVHNAHFIAGLVGHKKVKASTYVGKQKNFKVKRYQSFVDGLLAGITFGIYTPTTTKFYVPLDSSKRTSSRKRRVQEDEED